MAKAGTDNPNWAYQYTALDELLSVSKDGVEVERYAYDAFGRRRLIATNGEAALGLVSDGMDRTIDVAANDSGANIERRYTHGGSTDEPLQVEAFDASGQYDARYTYHADHLGSIRFLTDSGGQIVSAYDYDAYGNIITQLETVEQPFLYTGREWDAAVELYHYRARAYDPATGRFIQEDPIGFTAGDLNIYRYVWNNPLSWTDPSGLAAIGYGTNAGQSTGQATAIGQLGVRLSCLLSSIAAAIDVAGNPEATAVDYAVSGFGLALECGAKAPGKRPRTKKKKEGGTCPIPGLGSKKASGFSFPKGTLIWTEDGLLEIENIDVDQMVWSRDETTGENVLRPVTETFNRIAREMNTLTLQSEGGANKHSVKLTPEHPVFVSDRAGDTLGWTRAGDIKAGDQIADKNGEAALTVLSNAFDIVDEIVYNFEVEEHHNYFADELGLLVHNGRGRNFVIGVATIANFLVGDPKRPPSLTPPSSCNSNNFTSSAAAGPGTPPPPPPFFPDEIPFNLKWIKK